MTTILFRVEAGPETGLGHLRRSASLATALQQEGIQSRFLVSGDPKCLDLLEPFGLSAEPLLEVPPWTQEDLQVTQETVRRCQAQALLVDAKQVSASYLTGFKQGRVSLIVRDDLAGFPIPAQMVINGNANAAELPYRSLNGETHFLLGPEYLVLSKEFWRPSQRVVKPKVGEILVILGGTDPHHLMPRLLKLLDEIPGSFSVTAVVGPFFEGRAEVAAAADGSRRCVTVVDSPLSVRDLMQEADLAVSAAGQTLYELACVGCPTVAIQVDPDQEGQLRAWAGLGCVRVAGEAKEPDLLIKVKEAVTSLMEDGAARSTLAKAGQRWVDGQGGIRVARAISSKFLSRKIPRNGVSSKFLSRKIPRSGVSSMVQR